MKVAFQGEIGAYSEEAVLALFPEAEVVPLVSFERVFEQVESGGERITVSFRSRIRSLAVCTPITISCAVTPFASAGNGT